MATDDRIRQAERTGDEGRAEHERRRAGIPAPGDLGRGWVITHTADDYTRDDVEPHVVRLDVDLEMGEVDVRRDRADALLSPPEDHVWLAAPEDAVPSAVEAALRGHLDVLADLCRLSGDDPLEEDRVAEPLQDALDAVDTYVSAREWVEDMDPEVWTTVGSYTSWEAMARELAREAEGREPVRVDELARELEEAWGELAQETWYRTPGGGWAVVSTGPRPEDTVYVGLGDTLAEAREDLGDTPAQRRTDRVRAALEWVLRLEEDGSVSVDDLEEVARG